MKTRQDIYPFSGGPLGRVGCFGRSAKSITHAEVAEFWRLVEDGASPAALCAGNATRTANVAAHTSGAPIVNVAPAEAEANLSAVQAAGLLNQAIRILTRDQPLDESAVRSICTDVFAELAASLEGATARTSITINEGPAIEIEGLVHEAVAILLKMFKAAKRRNVMVIGPAGTGKSTIARHLHKLLGFTDDTSYGEISGSAGVSEWKLIGRSKPEGDKLVWSWSTFARLYRDGGVFLADELDAFDPNVLLTLNNALAGDHMHLEGCETPVIKRSPDFYFLGAANTCGTGADFLYAGRNQLDTTTLDRFGGCAQRVWVDYSRYIEKAACPDDGIRRWAYGIRERIAAGKLRRLLTTRFLESAYQLTSCGAFTFDEVKANFFLGWSKDETARVSA